MPLETLAERGIDILTGAAGIPRSSGQTLPMVGFTARALPAAARLRAGVKLFSSTVLAAGRIGASLSLQ